MKLEDIARELGLTELTPEGPATVRPTIERGYASDLLSDVLAHAPEGGVLVTLQVHLNVIAVASHAELAAVIFAGGRRPRGRGAAPRPPPRASRCSRRRTTPSTSWAGSTPWA